MAAPTTRAQLYRIHMKIGGMSLENRALAEQLYNSAGLDPLVDAGAKDYDRRLPQEDKLINRVIGPRTSDMQAYGGAVARGVAFAIYTMLSLSDSLFLLPIRSLSLIQVYKSLDIIICWVYTNDRHQMDNRIRIRKGKQTVRITVTITVEQHTRLKALAAANGFNTSELARYALVQLFKQPYIFLSHGCSSDKQ